MAKGFVDRVLMFMGIQEEPVETEEPAPAPERTRGAVEEIHKDRRRRLVSLPGLRGNEAQQMSVVVLHPRIFDEVETIAGILKDRRPVVIALDACEREVAKRIIDFVSGATYALDGHMRRLADDIFLCTPSHVSIDEAAAGADESEELQGKRRPDGLF